MKNIIIRGLALIILCAFSTIVKAEETISKTEVWANARWLLFNKENEVEVIISDQVEDGCWTNSKSVKTVVELELKRSGYKLADENTMFSKRFYLTSLGYEASGTCIVTYRIELWWMINDEYFFNGHKTNSYINTQAWASYGVLSGPKNGINTRIKESYVEIIQSFLIKIDQIRNDTLEVIKEAADISKDESSIAFWSSYNLD